MTLKCVVPGCKAEDQTLHRFPSPRTHTYEFKRWLEILHMNALFSLTPDKVYAIKRICGAHFLASCKSSDNSSLHVNAVPTIGVPDVHYRVHLTANAQKLYTVALHSRSHASRSSKRIQNFKERLKAAKQFTTLPHVEKQRLTLALEQFFRKQKRSEGRQFTHNEKKHSLTLLKNYPRSYNLLQKLFTLPCKQTLRKFLNRMTLSCGIYQHLFKILKKVVTKLEARDKFCVLMFDEIRLQAQLGYNQQEDVVEGFVDNGEQRSAVLADRALVFMVRGIYGSSWKQAVAFTFSKGVTPSAQLVEQLTSVLQSLFAIGLRPVATVCDQSSMNIGAVNTLLRMTEESYQRRGLEWPGGFFTIGSKKIFPLYDVPHLLKGIRNHLLTKGLRYTENNMTRHAKWEHLVALYETHRKDLEPRLSLLPRITNAHIFPTQVQKDRIKLCSQVFSQQVAASMHLVAKYPTEGLVAEMDDTARLLLFFDKLFDSVNSRSFDVPDHKPLRAPLTKTSGHFEFWQHAIQVLSSMEFIEPATNVVSRPLTLTNWVATLHRLELLWKNVRAIGLRYLQVRNCNQDPLENFFASIRGARGVKPSCRAFIVAFKTLTLNNFPVCHFVGANCEVDEAEVALCTLDELFARPKKLVNAEATSSFTCSLPNITDGEITATTGFYSSGLVIKQLRAVYKKCKRCNMDLFAIVTRGNNKGTRLKYLNYACATAFVTVKQIVQQMIPKYCNHTKFCSNIANFVRANVDFTFLTCKVHKERVKEIFIKKTIEVVLYRWIREVNQVLSGKNRRRTSDDEVKKQALIYYNKRQKTK